MSLRIFETDETAARTPLKPRDADVTYHLKSGIAHNGIPTALDFWAFTTDDPVLANQIAEEFDAGVTELDVAKGHDQFIQTQTDTVDILVEGPGSLDSRMVLFGASGVIHECDGVTFISGEDKGEPCGCPPAFADRKALAQKGRGPKPLITIKGVLESHPEWGVCRYQTSSWSLVRELPAIEQDLMDAWERAEGRPIRVRLRLRHEEYTTRRGRFVSYTRPVFEVIGAA